MNAVIIVRRPGKADRHFADRTHAIEYLIEHKGPAHVFDGEGRLILTKGLPRAEA